MYFSPIPLTVLYLFAGRMLILLCAFGPMDRNTLCEVVTNDYSIAHHCRHQHFRRRRHPMHFRHTLECHLDLIFFALFGLVG